MVRAISCSGRIFFGISGFLNTSVVICLGISADHFADRQGNHVVLSEDNHPFIFGQGVRTAANAIVLLEHVV